MVDDGTSSIDVELSNMKCPTCGTFIVNATWRRDNEFWNKSYEFQCGFAYVHRGHDNKKMVRANCEQTPWLVARKNRRIAATEILLEAVKALTEVDEDYRKELTDILNRNL